MAGKALPTSAIEVHQIQSALLKCGVSPSGAQQFATGGVVTNPADRKVITSMVGQLLESNPSANFITLK